MAELMSLQQELDSRSPLLASAPPPERRHNLGLRIGWRALALAAMTVLGMAIALMLKRTSLRPGGPGHPLLWAHDHLYLPLKGYLFTMGYPWSLTWWLTLILLLALGLVGFVLVRPLTRRLHIRLVRLSLRSSRTRRLLRRWCHKPKLGWLSFDRLGTGLITAVVEHDRESAIAALDTEEWPGIDDDDEPVEKLVSACRLSSFSASVQTRRVAAKADLLAPISALEAALLRLELLAPKASRSKPETSSATMLRQQLEAELAALLVRLCPDPRTLTISRSPIVTLHPRLLARDLGYLINIEAKLWPTDQGVRIRAVLEAAQERRQLIDNLRRHIELGLPFNVCLQPASSLPELREELPPPGFAPLAVDVMIGLAVRRQVPELALAFLDSLEALRFTLLAAGQELVEQSLGSSKLAAFATIVCQQLPRTSDYRICAQLLNRQLAMAEDLRQARARSSKILLQEDIELMRSRINLLLIAAADPREATETARWEAG
jgi:hypothetical protein